MSASRSNKTLKFLDRYAGIALLLPTALRPKRSLDRPSVRRIGLLKTAAIGDTLLLAGLVADVNREYPGATVILITGKDNAAAAELLRGPNDEHLVIDVRKPLAAARSVRSARLDVIVDFGSWPRFDALLATWSGAGYRVGFRTDGQFRHFGFDRSVPHGGTHERENYANLLATIGVRAESPAAIRPPGVLSADRYPPRPYVVLHPWAGGVAHEAREWAPARWLAVAKWAEGRGLKVVLSGAPSEVAASAALAAELERGGVAVIDAAGRYSIPELADVLAASDAVISVNTGVAHLAGLVGARTVSLQGPTSSKRWGPLGPRVRCVDSALPGCGYLDLGFEYGGQRMDCMDGVSVDAVFAALEELLAGDAKRVSS